MPQLVVSRALPNGSVKTELTSGNEPAVTVEPASSACVGRVIARTWRQPLVAAWRFVRSEGLEESVWLCPIEARRQVDSSREGILEGFSPGSYRLLVDYTGRLFRDGKAAILRELSGIFDSKNPGDWDPSSPLSRIGVVLHGVSFYPAPARTGPGPGYRRGHAGANRPAAEWFEEVPRSRTWELNGGTR